MMAALPDFELLYPASAADAVKLRAAHPASRFIAGGTDLLPNLRRGLAQPDAVIDISRIAELGGVDVAANGLRIGAGVTLAKLAGDTRIRSRWPALAQAATSVAGPTHRTSATLGGNLCLDTRCMYYNQSEFWREGNQFCMKLKGDVCRVAKKSKRCLAAFSGDVAPALIALDATVELLGAEGTRRIPLAQMYRDDGKTWLTLAPDELLLRVHVPAADGWVSAYEKVRVRGAIDFPLAGVAVALKRKGDVLEDLRIACTGVASRPPAVDGLDELKGRPLDAAALAIIAAQTDFAAGAMKTTVVDALYRRGTATALAKRISERLWNSAA